MSVERSNYLYVDEKQYAFREELIKTANAIVAAGKGILAADESTGTIGKRFKDINIPNTRENRRDYRKLLFTTPELEKYISGVILFEETLFETDAETNKPLVEHLTKKNIILGIKTDKGTKNIPFCDEETYTQGITDLDERCKKYYAAGARFCKWRAVLRISNNTPSPAAIAENAFTLAKYAAISQANGLVPIVEPEILMDGDHDLEVCRAVTEKVVAACYKALNDQHVLLEGTLLKPNMVSPGAGCKVRATPQQVAVATVTALSRTVPPAMPGVTFLSGGQSEEEATVHLNEINRVDIKRPWSLTFSYGRALQKSCIAAWAGKAENVTKAQEVLLMRAKANGYAATGKYTGFAADENAKKSLYEKGYKY